MLTNIYAQRRWMAVVFTMAALEVLAPEARAAAPAPFQILANSLGAATATTPGTVLVGDSLIWGLPAQSMANHMASVTGRGAVVAASGGASTKNFVTLGWLDDPPWGGPNLTTIGNYNAFFKPSITVIALGSNDARIMTSNPGSYSSWSHAATLIEAINQAKTHSTCVFLVNVANHWSSASSANIATVNLNIDGATAYSWVNKVFKIDWASYSAGQESWFAAPGDIHHSPVGKLYYAELIARIVNEKIRAGLC